MTEPGTQEPQPDTFDANASGVAASSIARHVGLLADAVSERLALQRSPTATYRLQMRDTFGFRQAAEIVDYLAKLGVSHLYSSPQLKSRRGSAHGYDIVDHSRLNDELGTPEDHSAFVSALREHGIGQLLDIVPNHMCVAGDDNAWWLDVLTHGPASRFAHYFDIDWQPVKRELEGQVLLPVLGDLYGKLLEEGQLPIEYAAGCLFVGVNGARLPLDPRTYAAVLGSGLAELEAEGDPDAPELLELQSILTAAQNLPARSETSPEKISERHRESIVLQGRLQRLESTSEPIRSYLESCLKRINGQVGESRSFDALDRLLSNQAYCLVHWKAGSDEMNYRRFFDVTELAAVCTENVDVFEATHQVVLSQVVSGAVDGFRVDHIDGLFDPTQYLWRLQWSYVRELGRTGMGLTLPEGVSWSDLEGPFFEEMHRRIGGPDPRSLFDSTGVPRTEADRIPGSPAMETSAARPALPLFVTVEKILGPEEDLPAQWPVTGTTGYDFLNLLNGLFVHPRGLKRLETQYGRFVDLREDLRETVYQSKRLILSGSMQSEVQLLAHRLDRLSYRHRRSRDYTLQALRVAIREIIACFSVYRTYIHEGHVTEIDRRIAQRAVALARRRNPAFESSVFDFVRDVLLLEQPPELDAAGRRERDFFIGRFQQVTSPVMAKGVEDTAFYRYVPLTSLEEVGGEPSHAVTTVQAFHDQNSTRQAMWPQAMLASTTHDTKRTEDVRARLNVLSEIPGPWRAAIQRWTRLNRKSSRDVDGQPAPSRNDEWLFYQSLVGVWPLSPPSPDELIDLTKRLTQYMEKATHEAKLRTSWISPNPAYDEAVRNFVADVMNDASGRFLEDVEAFVNSIATSGLYNSAAQVLLKILSPGIPDIYQGQEVWDFSLVDPDNRRPVDYALRRTWLDEIVTQAENRETRLELARSLARNPRDPRMKLFVTWTALQVRKEAAGLRLKAEGRDPVEHKASTLNSSSLLNQSPHTARHEGRVSEYVPLPAKGERAVHVCALGWRNMGTGPGPYRAIVVAPRLMQTLTAQTPDGVPCGSVWADTSLDLGLQASQTYENLFAGRCLTPREGRLELRTLLEDFPLALLVPCEGPA